MQSARFQDGSTFLIEAVLIEQPRAEFANSSLISTHLKSSARRKLQDESLVIFYPEATRWERGKFVKKNIDRAFLTLLTDCKLQKLVSHIKETRLKLRITTDQYVYVSSGGLGCLILRGAWANVAGAIYYVGFETQCAAYKFRFRSAVRLTTKFQPGKNERAFSWELMEIVNATLQKGLSFLLDLRCQKVFEAYQHS